MARAVAERSVRKFCNDPEDDGGLGRSFPNGGSEKLSHSEYALKKWPQTLLKEPR